MKIIKEKLHNEHNYDLKSVFGIFFYHFIITITKLQLPNTKHVFFLFFFFNKSSQ